jgi:hypothetical protein
MNNKEAGLTKLLEMHYYIYQELKIEIMGPTIK